MDISIELTFSPLTDSYEPHIINFIKQLRKSKFKVIENPLSTQIYGPYDEVMSFLTHTIKLSFKELDAAVLHMKMVTTDRSDYAPNF